jgi:ParB-like chromosome segregation protein Spo0J
VERVQIAALLRDDTPRLAGEDAEHIQVLAQMAERLPPIVVHRATMRVLDGFHRLRAAELRGEVAIDARLFDGDENQAFLLAVHSNIAHGLPLTLSDRKAAALRILAGFPQGSDRAVAAVVGLDHKTVGVLRRSASGEIPQLTSRVGRDGRARRDGKASLAAAGRYDAMVTAIQPARPEQGETANVTSETNIEAFDFEKARTQPSGPAGALETANRATDSDGTVNPSPRPEEWGQARTLARSSRNETREPVAARIARFWPSSRASFAEQVERLARDPSLRFTESGRALVRLLRIHSLSEEEWIKIEGTVPDHTRIVVASCARACSEVWRRLAERLEAQPGSTP